MLIRFLILAERALYRFAPRLGPRCMIRDDDGGKHTAHRVFGFKNQGYQGAEHMHVTCIRPRSILNIHSADKIVRSESTVSVCREFGCKCAAGGLYSHAVPVRES